jgi:hypothetical protein
VGEMQEHVVNFSPTFSKEVSAKRIQAVSLIFSGEFSQAELSFKKLYSKIRKRENRLPEGKRFHKGDILYWWGFSLIFQKSSNKVSEGYEKLLLAYIEDLLDYPNFSEANKAPAYKALKSSKVIGKSLLDLVQYQVKRIREKYETPKDPTAVLKPLGDETQEALEQPPELSLKQIKPALHEWLNKKGPKEKRVFVGGNYRNIAILNFINKVVSDIDFVPIMAIHFPETSKQSYEKMIHDASIEMLSECSFAIFEVTFSNGHLMEIERVKDFPNLKTILVYQTTKHGAKPIITSMLMSKAFKKKGYRNFTELTAEINSFLLYT